jgi:Domain of unknown function (DUF4258)
MIRLVTLALLPLEQFLRFGRLPLHICYGPSMSRYDLSRHVKDVISARQVRLVWLEQVLDSPEVVEADRDDPELVHHVGRIKEHGNRALRVVFNNSVSPVRIVTVYFDRKMKGRL